MEPTLSVFEASRNAVASSLQNILERFITFIPVLIGALVILIIGWLIAVAVGNLVARLLKAVKFNELFDRISGFRSALHKAGMELNAPAFVGGIVKWLIIIITLLAASDILGLSGVSLFLNQIIAYIPNIVVAAVMIFAGIMFGNFVQKITKASAETARIPHSGAAAAVAKWAIYVFTFVATLMQLGVAEALLQTLVTGLVAMIAIAGGLSFGLGGKDIATRILEHLKRDVTNRK